MGPFIWFALYLTWPIDTCNMSKTYSCQLPFTLSTAPPYWLKLQGNRSNSSCSELYWQCILGCQRTSMLLLVRVSAGSTLFGSCIFISSAFILSRMIESLQNEAMKSEEIYVQLQGIQESVRLALLNCLLNFAGKYEADTLSSAAEKLRGWFKLFTLIIRSPGANWRSA